MSLFPVKRYLENGDDEEKQREKQEEALQALKTRALKLQKNDFCKKFLHAKKSQEESQQQDLPESSPSSSDEESETSEEDEAMEVETATNEVEQTTETADGETAEDGDYNPLEVLKGRIKEGSGFQILGDDFDEASTGSKKVKRVLPVWLSAPTVIEDVSTMAEAAAINKTTTSVIDHYLAKVLKENLAVMGIEQLFPVQEGLIPAILRGTMGGIGEIEMPPPDICVSAATGSGKTLAFAIPIVQALHQHTTRHNTSSHHTHAVVVLPTRELASQVYQVFVSLCKQTSIKCALLIGAKGIANERKNLVPQNRFGVVYSANIVVCTPGRLVDHLNSTTEWSLQFLRFLVIDEADRMMDLLKHDWLNKIEQLLISKGRNLKRKTSVADFERWEIPLQKLLFSATLSADPEKLENLNLFQPRLFTAISKPTEDSTEDKQLAFVGKYTTPVGLQEYMVICETEDKLLNAVHLILKFDRCICFTESVKTARQLSTFMQLYIEHAGEGATPSGFVCRQFSSAMRAKERNQTMKDFKNKKINALICSDAAARGLDVNDVTHVISYDVPPQIKTYVHRVGRTARAGKEGFAYSILTKEKVFNFKKMLTDAGKNRPKKMKPLSVEEQKKYLPVYHKVLPLLHERLEKNKQQS